MRELVLAVLASVAVIGSGSAETWRIEMEEAGDGDVNEGRPGRKVEKAEEARGGAYLGGMLWRGAESHPIPTRIPSAGTYRVWVRHYQATAKPTSFYVLLRDDVRDGIWLEYLDYRMERIPVARPADPVPEALEDAKAAFTWSSFNVALERPMAASVSVGPGFGVTKGKVGIDYVVLSDDSGFDPTKADCATLPTEPGPVAAREVAGLERTQA